MANFKARARSLDLLGRQQIAGIPTAINELFKNAHDAYADNVDIDYFRKDRLLILRDNGLGMTRQDFETRWLTLGTESKFTNRKTPPPPKAIDKEERPVMGEKGIGRLAIASIGSQVLILTKAKRENKVHKITAAYINWEIFELPGLDLDQVVVPIREFDEMPDADNIEEMKLELINSFEKLYKNDDITFEELENFKEKVFDFNISPQSLAKSLIGNFSFEGENSGTHFYISPTSENLNNDIDGSGDKSQATKIEQMLIGFSNTMTPDHPTPRINTAFRDYKSDDGVYTSLFDKEEFFTPEDFQLADHHFRGTFDEFGQFDGEVTIYNERKFNHKINWNGNKFKQTECGSFSINVAYFQGRLLQSTMSPEDHARIYAKAEKFGALYLYKDNIRILPYGNADYDWLEIEKNRSKSAAYYFFSFRRMFGVIDIDRLENLNLKEKAGREGFIENKAFRQFRDILKSFFVQLAEDFFREGTMAGPKAEFWAQKRDEREAHYKALEQRQKQSKFKRDKFISSLTSFFNDLNTRKQEDSVKELVSEIEDSFNKVAYIEDPDEASQALIEQEMNARRLIDNYKQKIKIGQPRGFIINKAIRADYEAYLIEIQKIENSVLKNAVNHIDVLVDDYTTRLKIEISKRKRLEQSVEYISVEAKKAASIKEKEAKEAVSTVTAKVKELANGLMVDLDNDIREVKDRFKTLNIDASEDFNLVEQRQLMEADISRSKDRATKTLESVINQLQSIYWEKVSNGSEIITSDQITDSLAEELDELRERVHADIELSQLGLAVGVIHHEFNSTVKSIRGSLKDLKAWTDVNEKLDGVYKNIKINFEHLEKYLGLFTPLNKRLNREKENIPSLEIKSFLLDLFGARFERHEIKLRHTKGFEIRKLFGFRSTFYPVFVNLIDNAIHWLKEKIDEGEKTIRLHADESGFYISNNGPTIPIQDYQRIFELGFSKKPNGRGMGLHISKEVLNGDSYDIFLDDPREGSTVTFKIQHKNS